MLKALKVKLDQENESLLLKDLLEYINRMEQGTSQLFTQELPKWRKWYDAIPAEVEKSFPWPRASNLVVPIIAIHVDTLVARLLSLIFKTPPLFTCEAFGPTPELAKDLIEDLFSYVGTEEEELDLYRVVESWLFDTVKLGTSVIKVPIVTQKEILVEPGLVEGDQPTFKEVIAYDGPKPNKIPFEDFMVWPLNIESLDKAVVKCHKVRLEKEQLQERAFNGFYDEDKVQKIINSPNQVSPTTDQAAQETAVKTRTIGRLGFTLYELWLKYPIQQGKFIHIIATVHKETNTLVRCLYNPHAVGDNLNDVFVDQRLFKRDDMYYGRGFADMLFMQQEEASTIHNQRRDNGTASNTNLIIVRKNTFIDLSFPLAPNKPVAVDDIDDIRVEKLGQPTQFSFEEEQVSLDLAERRSGISPPMIGFGAGATGGKRGVYTAMGTMSMLQEGNMRTDLNLMDIRFGLTRVGKLCLKGYALGGLHPGITRKFGDKAQQVQQLVKLYSHIMLRLTASSASLNKEVEKQTSMMLVETVGNYYGQVSQLVTQIMSLAENPDMQAFMVSIYKGSRLLMHNILRLFDYGDTERMLPSFPGIDGPSLAQQQDGQAPPPEAQGVPGPMPQQPMGAPQGVPGMPGGGGPPPPPG